MGLEHQVELAGLGEAVLGAAVRAGVAGRRACRGGTAPCSCLQSTSGSVKLARWPEASQTAGGDRIDGVEADDVVAQLHHRAPPGVLDVAQQQHAEGPVVVGGAEAAVDLGRREHEAAPLAEVDDLVEQLGIGRGGHGGRLPAPIRAQMHEMG